MSASIEWTLGLRFIVALAVGFLIGLEREGGRRQHPHFFFGGIRTFPVVSIFGFACAYMADAGYAWILPAGLISVTAIAVTSYIEKMKTGRFGATSETSVLLTYLAGALACVADVRLPVAIGVIVALLLSEKPLLESYVERLDKNEFLATLKFLLVTVVIYPALPNADFTIYHLNPARIWQLVVLVSAVGFMGYILSRKLGSRVGLPVSGLLGGIVSSTAVSIAAGRLAGEKPEQSALALKTALLASSVMYLRLIGLITVFCGSLAMEVDWRLGVLGLVGLILAMTAGWGHSDSADVDQGSFSSLKNPIEIGVAMLFALLFVGLRIATTLAHTHFGQLGVWGMGAISGLVDVDPFVLSATQGALSGRLMIQAVLVALLVNTMAKGIYFVLLSGRNRAAVLWRYGILACCHIPLMWI
jgi:uncharacterized membrane protein (DUF4010 family)